MKTANILGIVGNTLYFAPFYGGDSIHEAEVSKWERIEWVERRGVADYSNYHFIELAHCVWEGWDSFITSKEVPPVTNADRYILLKYAMLEDKIARWEEEDDAYRDEMPF